MIQRIASLLTCGCVLAGAAVADCPPAPDHSADISALLDRVQAAESERAAQLIGNATRQPISRLCVSCERAVATAVIFLSQFVVRCADPNRSATIHYSHFSRDD